MLQDAVSSGQPRAARNALETVAAQVSDKPTETPATTAPPTEAPPEVTIAVPNEELPGAPAETLAVETSDTAEERNTRLGDLLKIQQEIQKSTQTSNELQKTYTEKLQEHINLEIQPKIENIRKETVLEMQELRTSEKFKEVEFDSNNIPVDPQKAQEYLAECQKIKTQQAEKEQGARVETAKEYARDTYMKTHEKPQDDEDSQKEQKWNDGLAEAEKNIEAAIAGAQSSSEEKQQTDDVSPEIEQTDDVSPETKQPDDSPPETKEASPAVPAQTKETQTQTKGTWAQAFAFAGQYMSQMLDRGKQQEILAAVDTIVKTDASFKNKFDTAQVLIITGTVVYIAGKGIKTVERAQKQR